MNPRTEKAIKEWLKLPKSERRAEVINLDGTPSVVLSQQSTHRPTHWPALKGLVPTVIARFTIQSIIKKRYPAKKKARKV